MAEFDDGIGRMVPLAQAEVGINQRAWPDERAGVEHGVSAGLGLVAQDGTHFGQPCVVGLAADGEVDRRPFPRQRILLTHNP